jgi:gas vesicle protein
MPDTNKSNIRNKIFLMSLGGTVGAILALLFAPKSGIELRREIADLSARKFDESVETAGEIAEAANTEGTRLVKAIRNEIAVEAETVGEFVHDATRDFAGVVRSRHIF